MKRGILEEAKKNLARFFVFLALFLLLLFLLLLAFVGVFLVTLVFLLLPLLAVLVRLAVLEGRRRVAALVLVLLPALAAVTVG